MGFSYAQSLFLQGKGVQHLVRSACNACAPPGRDYVLRRVLRRGVRYGQDTLKAPPGFFHGLVDSVVASMGHFYPELVRARDHIVNVIRCGLFDLVNSNA